MHVAVKQELTALGGLQFGFGAKPAAPGRVSLNITMLDAVKAAEVDTEALPSTLIMVICWTWEALALLSNWVKDPTIVCCKAHAAGSDCCLLLYGNPPHVPSCAWQWQKLVLFLQASAVANSQPGAAKRRPGLAAKPAIAAFSTADSDDEA